MHGHLSNSVREKLNALDHQIRRRTLFAVAGYTLGAAGVILLFRSSPFVLNRIGSAVLLIAFVHMLSKVLAASRDSLLPRCQPREDALLHHLQKVDAQIQLLQSLIYNLPFLVGANLFFIGLPGTGSPETKAWLDCLFLLATVLLLAASYAANQRLIRKDLLPLRKELEKQVTRIV